MVNKLFTAVVAGFTDSVPAYSAKAYTAIISWGDGTQSVGLIKRLGSGQFSVSGTHRYAAARMDKVVITIERGKLARTVVDSTAVVGLLQSLSVHVGDGMLETIPLDQ